MSAENEGLQQPTGVNFLYKPNPDLVNDSDPRLWVETHTEEGGAYGQRGVLVLNADGSVGFLPEHEMEDGQP